MFRFCHFFRPSYSTATLKAITLDVAALYALAEMERMVGPPNDPNGKSVKSAIHLDLNN